MSISLEKKAKNNELSLKLSKKKRIKLLEQVDTLFQFDMSWTDDVLIREIQKTNEGIMKA